MKSEEFQKKFARFLDNDFVIPEFNEDLAREVRQWIQVPVDLLKALNGFYAFSRGLHFFGLCETPQWHNIVFWNAEDAWRTDYGKSLKGIIFFAEDYFGGQYGYRGDSIIHLEPETGHTQVVADNFDDWIEMILSDPDGNLLLGLLRKWQAAGNQLKFGEHLFPRIPFVLGGDDKVANLTTVGSLDNMRFKAHLASQIAKYPDGTKIEWVFPSEKK